MDNPIVELSELVQRLTGKNIVTRVLSKSGPDHNPVITVEIELPDGAVYQAEGANKKVAKQEAAKIALEMLT